MNLSQVWPTDWLTIDQMEPHIDEDNGDAWYIGIGAQRCMEVEIMNSVLMPRDPSNNEIVGALVCDRTMIHNQQDGTKPKTKHIQNLIYDGTILIFVVYADPSPSV